ncbi:MAG TPA: metal-dependent hydrolase [Gemmatimonadetes bacterium]|jgi:L-ascorbate metabolism protein UlaG (beta-lactamase superfamily)|nr:metal-dependent hydrolase [Gemmatimonadota bacterium]
MAKLDFYGHATFGLTTEDDTRIIIDPFFAENPWTEVEVNKVEADFIFCTHGHFDHFADAIPLAKASGAKFVGSFELVEYVETQGVTDVHPMHIGGGWDFSFGRVKMVTAVHGGRVYGEGAEAYTTNPGGFVFDLGPGRRLYHAGDTGLTLDMKLLRDKVDIALLPIGDNFTMGLEDAVTAVEFIRPAIVIPCHYQTWPYIEQDPETFKTMVGDRATVEILEPGQSSYDF